MNIEEIQALISADSEIDQNKLDTESLRIPMLHAKYWTIFVQELRILKGLDIAFKTLKRDRSHYYLGKADDPVYKEEPLDHKVLKADLDLYLDSDEKLNAIRGKYEMQKIKVEMVEAFLKALNNRSFQIKNAVEWRRFQAGS